MKTRKTDLDLEVIHVYDGMSCSWEIPVRQGVSEHLGIMNRGSYCCKGRAFNRKHFQFILMYLFCGSEMYSVAPTHTVLWFSERNWFGGPSSGCYLGFGKNEESKVGIDMTQ